MSNSYRFDNRTEAKFAADIKRLSKAELDIAIRLGIFFKGKHGYWPEIFPNGIDFTGSLIKDNNLVVGDADFIINNRLVEITQSHKVCSKWFHEKQSKINRAIKDKIDIVFVNGYCEKQPQFVWLPARKIQEFTYKSISKYGEIKHPGLGWKLCYRYDLWWFRNLWQTLPNLTLRGLPKHYKDLIDA